MIGCSETYSRECANLRPFLFGKSNSYISSQHFGVMNGRCSFTRRTSIEKWTRPPGRDPASHLFYGHCSVERGCNSIAADLSLNAYRFVSHRRTSRRLSISPWWKHFLNLSGTDLMV